LQIYKCFEKLFKPRDNKESMEKEAIILLVESLAMLIAAIPAGMILKKLCSDELNDGKKWFKIILIIGLIAGALILPIYFEAGLTLFYIAILARISIS